MQDIFPLYSLVVVVAAVYLLEQCQSFRCARVPAFVCPLLFVLGIVAALVGSVLHMSGKVGAATRTQTARRSP